MRSKLHSAALPNAEAVQECQQLFDSEQTSTLPSVAKIKVDDDMLCDKQDDINEQSNRTNENTLSIPDCDIQPDIEVW